METIRLPAAQAMIRWLSAQMTEDGARFIEGVWAIFGHGNVARIGEALHGIREALPTLRGQNKQTMAHAAIAYAKTMKRKRATAVTSSIGPGAINMVTAAALAHVNRLPVLLIPGDVFAGRRPDPVLQQIEDWGDGKVSANNCFRPVVRYFDRIMRPEQLLSALPRAMAVLTDNRGYGCINRLQIKCGGAEFNNMYVDSNVEAQPAIDFVAHAGAMGRSLGVSPTRKSPIPPRGSASTVRTASPSSSSRRCATIWLRAGCLRG